ncbi:hypothetical protein DITRI_Ditri01bG0163900 [Diplodiscus trichospermus]
MVRGNGWLVEKPLRIVSPEMSFIAETLEVNAAVNSNELIMFRHEDGNYRNQERNKDIVGPQAELRNENEDQVMHDGPFQDSEPPSQAGPTKINGLKTRGRPKRGNRTKAALQDRKNTGSKNVVKDMQRGLLTTDECFSDQSISDGDIENQNMVILKDAEANN